MYATWRQQQRSQYRMTTQEFIEKWKASTLKERAASQEHFIDLCHLIGHPTPAEVDPDGTSFTFEKGVRKTAGSEGWADVWKKGYFAWEYKGKKKDLNAAFVQLKNYGIGLENPPLLVVSDMDTIIIHTNFTNTPHKTYAIAIDDIGNVENLNKLKWLFYEPERLKPGVTIAEITQKAAGEFAEIAYSMRSRGHDPLATAHFLNKILFCLFAEDVGLLPKKLFERLLGAGKQKPGQLTEMLADLFKAMSKGGRLGIEPIDWFNGGLFDGNEVIPLEKEEISALAKIAKLDWSQIEPSIFGTLFERGLDPEKRSQLGAHFTDQDSIMRIVQPVVIDPLLAEWVQIKQKISEALGKRDILKSAGAQKKWLAKANELMQTFLYKLSHFKILDPACGSGNFLYLALKSLKDIEYMVNIEAEHLGLEKNLPEVGPQCVLGIELNTYAAELARVTIWIGEIQWMLNHNHNLNKNPILKKLDKIDCRDALMNIDGSEAQWPEADVVIGNPPFIGDKRMISELGEEYVTQLRKIYKGRVPGGADFVTYWFEKARLHIEESKLRRAGLVSTNSIRGGKNREILKRIADSGRIFNAWSDEPWINEGAAVRVSITAFGKKKESEPVFLDGEAVLKIHTDLTGGCDGQADFTQAKRISENKGLSFMGITKSGPFEIPDDLARSILSAPNPHGRPNSDVLRPSVNGSDLAKRPSGRWIINFGVMSEEEASFYEQPFQYAEETIKPARQQSKTKKNRKVWWMFERPRPEMYTAFGNSERYIATCLVSKHRFFTWQNARVVPENVVIVIARSDDTTFGILHSKYHELWSLRMCTWLGKGNDPRYTPTTTFETFPFPEGLQPNIPATDYADDPHAQAIAEAAKRLVELRDNWLNPPEWVKREPEVVEGYPDRVLPVDENAAKELKKRTLTNLYNQRPTWLDNVHKALDEAVASAYGWDTDMSDDEILKRLFELNQQRANSES